MLEVIERVSNTLDIIFDMPACLLLLYSQQVLHILTVHYYVVLIFFQHLILHNWIRSISNRSTREWSSCCCLRDIRTPVISSYDLKGTELDQLTSLIVWIFHKIIPSLLGYTLAGSIVKLSRSLGIYQSRP